MIEAIIPRIQPYLMHDKKCPNRELQCNAYMVMWVNCEPYLGKLPKGPYSAQRLLRDAKSKENGQVGLLLGAIIADLGRVEYSQGLSWQITHGSSYLHQGYYVTLSQLDCRP